MGSKGSARDERRRRVEEMQAAARAKDRRRSVALWGSIIAVVVVIGLALAFVITREQANKPSLAAVETFEVTANHVETPVTYAQTPPVGGDHSSVWLNCGIYDKPVRNENAVHSLEHGAVWVTYRPDLAAAQVETLRNSLPSTYTLLSPYENLPAPVVASAWGKQLKLDSADDPRLAAFVKEYRQGPQTPEPGASCTGGTDGTTPAGGMTK